MDYERQPFMDIPSPGAPAAGEKEDIFAEKSRAAWHSREVAVPRCDFSSGKAALTPVSGGFRAVSLWRRSVYGMSLGEIKEAPDMPAFCARHLSALVSSVIGKCLSPDEFAIVSPPKRRHPGRENFASRMCALVAAELGLEYVDDFAICRSRQRIGAQFSIGACVPRQKNIIVLDDIITTGSTLAAMHRLLQSIPRNGIYFAAILNKK